jgi:hypothetical protein
MAKSQTLSLYFHVRTQETTKISVNLVDMLPKIGILYSACATQLLTATADLNLCKATTDIKTNISTVNKL